MIIRSKTFKEWMKFHHGGDAADIATHGCVAGFSRLIYYRETGKLYEHFKDEIWNKLSEMADENGEDNIVSLIASFNGSANVSDPATFENLLVWAVAEEYAREMETVE